jgi:hypothetical protein
MTVASSGSPRPLGTPIRRDVHRPAATSRTDESPTPKKSWAHVTDRARLTKLGISSEREDSGEQVWLYSRGVTRGWPALMNAINDLIQKNDRDIARFREHMAKLLSKRGTQRHVSDFERCIAIAEKSNSMLRAARERHAKEP